MAQILSARPGRCGNVCRFFDRVTLQVRLVHQRLSKEDELPRFEDLSEDLSVYEPG
jgi:hypothetical protein